MSLKVDVVNQAHPVIERILKYAADSNLWRPAAAGDRMKALADEVDRLVPDLRIDTDGFLPLKLVDVKDLAFSSAAKDEREEMESAGYTMDVRSTRRFFRVLLNELVSDIGRVARDTLLQTRYLGPLRSYPPRHIAFTESADLGTHAGGGSAWAELLRNPGVRKKVNAWLSDAKKLKTPYKIKLSGYRSLDDFKSELPQLAEIVAREVLKTVIDEGIDQSEAYLEVKRTMEEVVVEDEALPSDDEEVVVRRKWRTDVHSDALETLVNTFLESERLAKRHLEPRLQDNTDLFATDIALIDTRTATSVSHRDVGIGISQVLPVLVNAFSAKGSLLAIEQPEIHLHPALQAELGDVFIESALGENQNICLLETHSEHLILRVLRRIRETTSGRLPEGHLPISPDDVALLYVDGNNRGAEVLTLRCDERGRLIDRCPGGFFEEGFNELFSG